MAKKNVTIYAKRETYVNEKNEKVEYDAFYMDLFGVSVKIKPNDGTGKAMLLAYLTDNK